MAESDQYTETGSSENDPRRGSHQSRVSSYSSRGRGRTNPVMKALHIFGVHDLREILDRKHKEEQDQSEQKPCGPQGRGRYIKPSEPSFVENPINIKVELQTATGKRHYSLSNDNKMYALKHISDYNHPVSCPGGNGGRPDLTSFGLGRGRGTSYRGRGLSYWGRGCSSDSGRYEVSRGGRRHDTARGRYETNSRGRSETDWSANGTYKEIQETSKGEQVSEWDRSEPERRPKDSNRGRSEFRRGRGRDPRGRDVLMRAKSTERPHEIQVDSENGGNRDGGAHIRSRSAEPRGDNPSRDVNGEARGRGRGGRGSRRGGRNRQEQMSYMDYKGNKDLEAPVNKTEIAPKRGGRGRGRGRWRAGKNRQEQSTNMNDAPSDILNQNNLVNAVTAIETEIESEALKVQEKVFEDTLEDVADERYDINYDDEDRELEGEVQDDQGLVDEKKEEVVKIKKKPFFNDVDHQQKKRTVRFHIGDKEEVISVKIENE